MTWTRAPSSCGAWNMISPTAQKKILDAGLPPRLAERLAFGR